jgi:hypothetical protein
MTTPISLPDATPAMTDDADSTDGPDRTDAAGTTREGFDGYHIGAPSVAFSQDDPIWGTSVIRGEDGTYHAFASRVSGDIHRWIFDSQIVRGTAPTPEGPFELQEVALPGRTGSWDHMTHNPTIHRAPDGTFLLYYLGTRYDERDRTEARDNQRIGLATAPSPAGPWSRRRILEPRSSGWDGTYVTNPAPVVEADGSITLIYKALNDDRSGFHLSHGVARADSYEGEYERVREEPFLAETHLEDPYCWRADDRYHLLLKDFEGDYADEGNDGVYAWTTDVTAELTVEPGSAYSTRMTLADGSTPPVNRRERPQVLFEDGEPTHLYTAVRYEDDRPANAVVAPITPR